jgi:hypothetical protein
MFSCFSRRDRLHGVEMNRRRNVNRLYLFISQQVAPLGIPPLRTKLFGKRRCQIGPGSTDSDKLAELCIAQSWRNASARDVATSNQSPSKFQFGLQIKIPLGRFREVELRPNAILTLPID